LVCGSHCRLVFGCALYFKDFLPGFGQHLPGGAACPTDPGYMRLLHFIILGLPLMYLMDLYFLVAAVVAVFPVSLGGGLGTRELVF
jgi:hypothetical protein